jgi:hypothetical protein
LDDELQLAITTVLMLILLLGRLLLSADAPMMDDSNESQR